MFQKTIQDGVHLKLMEERHAPVIFAAVERDRAYLREWLAWVDSTTSVDQPRAYIKTSLEAFANNEGLVAGIWCGDEFAGGIGTHEIDWLNRKVEMGYWIASRFQGRGIVTDACRAMLQHVFEELELNRVEIHCAPANEKSCGIARRLGFTLEGVMRERQFLNGQYVDMNVYALLAREWNRKKTTAST